MKSAERELRRESGVRASVGRYTHEQTTNATDHSPRRHPQNNNTLGPHPFKKSPSSISFISGYSIMEYMIRVVVE
jgi:hypothetical protein